MWDNPSMSLVELEVGQTAVVESLEGASSTTQRRLFSLGFVPGEQLCLEQRTPAYVVRLGWTRVALDRETAERVSVLPDPGTCNAAEHPG